MASRVVKLPLRIVKHVCNVLHSLHLPCHDLRRALAHRTAHVVHLLQGRDEGKSGSGGGSGKVGQYVGWKRNARIIRRIIRRIIS
eukprot:8152810-Pyramimonas_sp.AAC.1